MYRSDLSDVTTGATTTYRDLHRGMERMGAWLADLGLGRGDIVAIWAPNSAGWAMAAFGAMAAGCAVTGVSPLATDGEIARQLNDARPAAIITTGALARRALELRAYPTVDTVIVLDADAPEGTTAMA